MVHLLSWRRRRGRSRAWGGAVQSWLPPIPALSACAVAPPRPSLREGMGGSCSYRSLPPSHYPTSQDRLFIFPS